MSVKVSDINKNLPRKGFQVRNDHHRYFEFYVDGKYTGAYTYVSHGSKFKEASNQVVSQMKNQLKLNTSREVRDLVACPMSEDQYKRILMDKGIVS